MRSCKYVCLVVLAVAFCLIAAGCGSHSSKSNEKVLTYASADYTTINSILNTHDELPDIIFSGLMTYDAKGNPIS